MENSIDKDVKKKRVSYSQFSEWYSCRHHWFLSYLKKLKIRDDSIHSCFGTSIHETIQLYIKSLYTQSAQDADSHDLHDIFKKTLDRELLNYKVEVTPEVKKEFYDDGDAIIDEFTKLTNRMKHFPSKKYEFIGSEDEIIMPIKNNVEFVCYIDIVLKEKSTGRYKIIDIKTSTAGWNKYTQANEAKISQILLYKAFFSRKYNVPIDMIDVEFFILRRKLWENYKYPQSRIQTFIPKNNQPAVARALNLFSEFITECFTESGEFIEDQSIYLKNPGKNKKNCTYCPHKGVNCDAKSDIPKDEQE